MSYPIMGGNPLLHTMVPLMGNMSNIPNGTNYMPQLTGGGGPGNVHSLSSPNLVPSHLPPAQNDSPLEFKNASNIMNKVIEKHKNVTNNNQMGAGPMDLENENENSPSIGVKRRERKISAGVGDDESSIDGSDGNSCTTTNSSKGLVVGSEMFLNGMMGVGAPGQHAHHHHPHQGFMMMSGMMMDPTTMAATLQMQQFPLLTATLPQAANPQSSSNDLLQSQQVAAVQIKEVITCKSCTLFPPNPNAPPPTTRERPPGCRTVFVGGLPENITEEIIREIFERCGEITTLRLSKKNFCHIRFVFAASVDSAIYLSGYRIRIANSSDAANCGRLHVDYAQARDDQYDWECKQRQLQREQRHRERLERDRLRPLSPPPIVHYTEHEASNTAEKLKTDETFMKAVQTLIVWLERGDCSKKNSNTFYTMIQSTWAHVRRLQNDKAQYEEELKRAREQYRKQMINMGQQFTQIEKVFNAASHKKVWDHFTKAQRKNIDLWKKQSMDTRGVQILDVISLTHDDDEMEMSDDDRDYKSNSSKRARIDNDHLKEENDNLRCQLEAYKNEVNLVKSDLKSDTDVREQQIKVLQETIRNLQTQLLENKMKEKEFSTKITDLEAKLKKANVKELLLKTKIVEASGRNSFHASKSLESEDVIEKSQNESSEIDSGSQQNIVDQGTLVTSSSTPQIKSEHIDSDEARIIGLVSTFLVVHPFGASPDYMCSYLQKIQPNLRPRELEEILGRYTTLFCEEVTGVGAKIERKWKFCGFDCNDSRND